jgi:hypothetical protein
LVQTTADEDEYFAFPFGQCGQPSTCLPAVANAPAALTGTYALLLVAMNLLRAVKPVWANNIDPLQAMADLISRRGTAAAHIAVLAGWLAIATLAGTAVTRRRALA